MKKCSAKKCSWSVWVSDDGSAVSVDLLGSRPNGTGPWRRVAIVRQKTYAEALDWVSSAVRASA